MTTTTARDVAISVDSVSKSFRVYQERNNTLKSALLRRGRSAYRDFDALKDVSLEIPQGSTFALVGDNGSGKSTLLKCIARILVPDSGTITRNGRMAAMLEVGSGFHPELSGRDNVYLNGSILGMNKQEIDRRFDDIVGFSGVEDFIDQPVKNYSSGMYVRLGFSVAIHTEPEVMLVDEILAVGDASFQEKCAEKFAEFRRDGRTVVVVSHSMPQLRAMADRAAYLDHGVLQTVGPARVVLEQYADAARTNIRTDAEGRVRWGSGEAQVERVEVLDAKGQSTGSIVATGDRVRLRLHYRAKSRVVHPNLALSVETPDGTNLWVSYSRDLGLELDHIDGRGAVEVIIPSLPLQAGSYAVHGGIIADDGENVIDFVREIAWLQVKPGPHRESGGAVAMTADWRALGSESSRIGA